MSKPMGGENVVVVEEHPPWCSQGPGKVLNEAEERRWAAAVAGVVSVGGGDVGDSGGA